MQTDPDHFELLGVPATFALDRAALDAAWRDVQARVHPDRHASGTAQERRVAMQWASRANEAYRTLRSPLSRARYLCERAGVDLQVETNTAMSTGFLMQQMEWREALDDARASRKQDALDHLAAELAAERDTMARRVGELLDVEHDYTTAAARVREWMFIEKFSEEIDAVADALADSH
ncbi:Fe-S protein assembly co-chaperone HscB [Pigmentiphaga litoralis]|uniref:Co-chaperone protein HscB homolog n=1 Tax=Pigmentiphaga litoralis TaxID=516702 RepID=A0A7Y9IVA0_9BURK|nr:Fe-S protein assembly co-chaperone HscB [Pigmentiphaga litoralis]NYE22678.1 molecular chaperone HscB [Pigmentiphaga litoralis]NYE83707.1 molecular chaperone HscB [Pigmentiphaga litoralis]